MLPPPPRPTLSPYTTLFRSQTGELPDRSAGALGLEIPQGAVERVARTAGRQQRLQGLPRDAHLEDRKSTRLNSSHMSISYAVFCLKKNNGDDGRECAAGLVR